MNSHCKKLSKSILVLSAALLLLQPRWIHSQSKDQKRETVQDYFQKWLKEDVVYIIAPEEKAVFEKLSTPEEKEQFIEQFWGRRDPDPRTPTNEFKEEHYRRIAYANDHFAGGWPGWRTDRGKVYIIHGPPDEIEDHPSGGTYDRPLNEGGGTTATYPFEIWRYRHIPGMDSSVELQFVDRDSSGEYRLALSPEEKDAFLFVPNAGFTLAEELGLSERKQRPYFSPGGSYPFMNFRVQDTPFARYESFVNVQRPPQIKFKDLNEVVSLKISYNELPFKTTMHYFRLNEARVLVPITLEVRHKHLTFEKTPGGAYEAKVAIYGRITSFQNQIVAEFEDEVVASVKPQDYESGLPGGSVYQRTVLLERSNRYRADLVLKDLSSGHIGAVVEGILPTSYTPEKLSASSIILSDLIMPAQNPTNVDEMFTLGDVRVRPNLDKSFLPGAYFAVYLQVYNVAINQDTRNPSFRARYRILREGTPVLEVSDERGESVQYFSAQRMVLIKKLHTESLPPGPYKVEVEFLDKIAGQTVTASDEFQILLRNR